MHISGSSMEDSKSNANNNNDNDRFLDALDEFPFDDCFDTIEPNSPPLHQLDGDDDASLKPKPSPEILSSSSLRRRRSLYQHIRNDTHGNDLENSNPISSVSFDSTSRAQRQYRISRSLKEIERGSAKPDSIRGAKEDTKENSTVTTADDDRVDESVELDLAFDGNHESSFNFVFVLAGLLIKAIAFQTSLLVNFFIFPIRVLCCAYMFVIDPFQAVSRGREYAMARLLTIWGVICDNVKPPVYEWLKEQKSVWKLALRFGWGFLWASYVCFVLIGLLVSAFIVSVFIMRHLVEKPVQMKETLTFDYTKNRPVAFVPIISCPHESRWMSSREMTELESLGAPLVIPPRHKLKVTVSLTMPESDYNRNLGIFQVRVDFLSASGNALASLSQPCILRFKSEPIRLLVTFLKVIPVITGYSSESQTLNVRFRGFTEGKNPTACLRVAIEQRAEFRPGAGVPEIYDASLTLESELPLSKRILWHWKKTVFIWISMCTFTMELLFMLLFCRPIIMPRIRPGDGSASNSALQNSRPAQS